MHPYAQRYSTCRRYEEDEYEYERRQFIENCSHSNTKLICKISSMKEKKELGEVRECLDCGQRIYDYDPFQPEMFDLFYRKRKD